MTNTSQAKLPEPCNGTEAVNGFSRTILPGPRARSDNRSVPRRRAPNLTGDQLEVIVRIIGRLPGKPTWADVIESVRKQLGTSYTRQALHTHKSILFAFQARKNGDSSKLKTRPVSARSKARQDRIRGLEEELERSRKREIALLEQYMRWSYNAHIYGLTEAMLDRPLPKIDRA